MKVAYGDVFYSFLAGRLKYSRVARRTLWLNDMTAIIVGMAIRA